MLRNLPNDHMVSKPLDVPLIDKVHMALLLLLKYKNDRMKIFFLIIIPDFWVILGRTTAGVIAFGVSISLIK